MSNQQVVDFVRPRLFEAGETAATDVVLSKICEQLCDECLSSDPDETDSYGCDNMTVLLVLLPKQQHSEDDKKEGAGNKRTKSYLLRPRKSMKTQA